MRFCHLQISPRIAETGRSSGEGNEKNRSSLHIGGSRQDRQTIEQQRTVVAPSTPPLVGANIRQCMTAAAAAMQQMRGAAATTTVPRPVSGVRRGTPALATANTRLASMATVNSGAPLRVSTTSAPSAGRAPHSAHAHCLTPSAANNSTVGINFRFHCFNSYLIQCEFPIATSCFHLFVDVIQRFRYKKSLKASKFGCTDVSLFGSIVSKCWVVKEVLNVFRDVLSNFI